MNEKTLATEKVFDGRILHVEVQQVELENGMRSTREIVRHSGAVTVLTRLPDGKFVFVKQFRKAIESDLIEAIAGGMEPGEKPEESAMREVGEESGYAVKSLKSLGKIVSTPGFCNEVLYCFLADVESSRGAQHPDEDENLDVILMSADEVVENIASGRIWDSKTLAVWAKYSVAEECRLRK